MTDIREGYVLAPHGRGPKQAKAALDAVEAAGLDKRLVKTHREGYLIPAEAAEHYEGELQAAAEPVEDGAEGETGSVTLPDGTETSTLGQSGDDGTNPDGTVGPDHTPADEKPEEPAKSASTEVWAQWAKAAHGYDPAEELTRAQLIEKYAAPAAG